MHINPIKNENNEIVKAGCLILNEEGHVLLVGDIEGKNWAFPKGHAEEGETIEQVALREAKEETGLTVQLLKRLSDITYTHGKTGELIRIAMFLAKPLELEIVAEQGTQVKFFDTEQAKSILRPNLNFILDELQFVGCTFYEDLILFRTYLFFFELGKDGEYFHYNFVG